MPKPEPLTETDSNAAPLNGGRRSAGALLLALACVLMVGCALALLGLRARELDAEQENLTRLTVSLAEQTALAFREFDIVLRETRPDLTPEAMQAPGPRLHRELKEHFSSLPQGQALLAFGPDGKMRAHSRVYPTPSVDISDRGYFKAHEAGDETLHIGEPLRNRVNNRWMISLSRRLHAPDGSFGGVIMAAVEMEYFSKLYHSLRLPEAARVELRREDGTLLAVYPFDEARLGESGPEPSPGTADKDSVEVVQQVPTMPLQLRLSVPRELALQKWRGYTWATAAGMLAVVAGVAAFTATRREHLRELQQRNELLQRSQAALRSSEARYRTIVDTANEGICAYDATGRITYVNRVLAGLVGMPEDQLLGQPLAALLHPAENPRGPVPPPWDHDAAVQFEQRLRGPGESEVWAIVSLTPQLDASGKPSGSFAMLTDISLRKEEERHREGIEGILRHDLRSPLLGLSAIPQLMLDEENLSEQQVMIMEEMRKYVKRLLRMVDAYLRLSKLERPGFELDARPLDLAALLADVETELKPLLSARRVRLAVARQAQALPVLGEEVLLQTMLANLIKNAAEAVPEGGVVEVLLGVDSAGLFLSVRNEGAVPEAIRNRFFQKYVTAGKRKGTGLGAYSARLIARAHGGEISLDASEPGHTTLRVTLPGLA